MAGAMAAVLLGAAAAPDARSLLSAPDPETADYGLRTRLGDAAFETLQGEVTEELGRRGVAVTAAGGCLADDQAEVVAGLLLARRSASAEAFRQDRAAARQALAQLEAQREPMAREDTARVDEFRAAIGLGPLADYRKQITCP